MNDFARNGEEPDTTGVDIFSSERRVGETHLFPAPEVLPERFSAGAGGVEPQPAR